MKRDFQIDELRNALAGFGVSARRCDPLRGCAHSLNFRVETEDGEVFAAKCFPSARRRMFARLEAHCASLRGASVPHSLFGGRTVEFGRWSVLAFKWIPGEGRMPADLTDGDRREFISAYGAFLDALSDDGQILPLRDYAAMKADVLAFLSDGGAPEIARELRAMPPASMSLPADKVRIVHGDLHWRNFHFDGGRVSGFLDVEELRFGTPAEDFVRYVVCAAEHLPWHALAARRRTLETFAAFVRETGLSHGEWTFAIDGSLIRKLHRKVDAPRPGIAVRLNMLWRFRFYRRLRSIVDEFFRKGESHG